MKLEVRSQYRNDARGLIYPEGRVIEVEDDFGRWLLGDAPGCFREVKPKAMRKPPENKMVEEPEESK